MEIVRKFGRIVFEEKMFDEETGVISVRTLDPKKQTETITQTAPDHTEKRTTIKDDEVMSFSLESENYFVRLYPGASNNNTQVEIETFNSQGNTVQISFKNNKLEEVSIVHIQNEPDMTILTSEATRENAMTAWSELWALFLHDGVPFYLPWGIDERERRGAILERRSAITSALQVFRSKLTREEYNECLSTIEDQAKRFHFEMKSKTNDTTQGEKDTSFIYFITASALASSVGRADINPHTHAEDAMRSGLVDQWIMNKETERELDNFVFLLTFADDGSTTLSIQSGQYDGAMRLNHARVPIVPGVQFNYSEIQFLYKTNQDISGDNNLQIKWSTNNGRVMQECLVPSILPRRDQFMSLFESNDPKKWSQLIQSLRDTFQLT